MLEMTVLVVDSSFSGTLFIKNGEGNNILEFRTTVGSILVDEDGTLVAKLTDGSEIKSEDYLTLDEDSVSMLYLRKGMGLFYLMNGFQIQTTLK